MAGNKPKLYKWGPKGPLVAKDTDPETFIEKKDLGILGGPNSEIVKKLPGYEWRATGFAVVKGGSLAKSSDVRALFGAPVVSVPQPTPVPPPAKPITSVIVESTSTTAQTNVPITFGQVFAPGDLPAGEGLTSTVPLQLDVKALHPDGSVRHAVISAVLPNLAAGEKLELPLEKGKPLDIGQIGPKQMVLSAVSVILDGVTYSAVNDHIDREKWLFGPVAVEFHSAEPLRDAAGKQHPHLLARFATRCYEGGRTRVDVVIENAWAYEPNPQNFTYDVLVTIGGRDVYVKKGLVHYHHSRWRKVFWVGEEPQVHIRHDAAYLIASRALPNYDQSVKIPEKVLADLAKKWTGKAIEPMGVGLANPYMPATGGRPELGLLPSWYATYLLSQDPRAKMVTLAHGDLSGSWSSHYRDKNTGLPVSLNDFPYMTIYGVGTDTKNPATKKQEAFPKLVAGTKTPNSHDISHQAAFAYLPYLVTGDYYYLEELQFWAMWDVFQSNPGYRKNVQGLLQRNQVRGQAWSLRTLGEAAYITPDSHPLKSHFLRILKANLDSYNATYPNNPAANKLGVVDEGAAVQYTGDTAVAPWQDDFFTAAVGHLVDLGFEEAKPLLKWKAQFPVGRMIGEGVCWLAAANYTYTIRSAPGAPTYATFAEAYRATVGEKVAALPCGDQVAQALGRKPGDMGGYSGGTEGFPSNMQPALAYAVGVIPEGWKAWEWFMARSVKPDYGLGPQFAIVPR